MELEEVRLIIQQAADAWLTGDADGFASLFSSTGKLIVPGNCWMGQAEIRQAVADFTAAYSAVKIEVRRIIIDGNQVVVEWYWEDTEKATNIRTQADDVIIVDFQEGRISCWREYIDTKTPTGELSDQQTQEVKS